ncbi:structure-specific recognition protein-domain-containing protein, partial [Gorgonomyces haynaldii]
MSSGATKDFDDIYLGGKNGVLAQGKFKLSEAGIGWKNATSGQIITVSSADIAQMLWMRVARDFEIKIIRKDNAVLKFDGFPRDSYESLQAFVKNFYGFPLEEQQVSTRGYNWGKVDFEGNWMEFTVGDKQAFEIPITQVANASMGAKGEVAIEFTPPPPADPNAPKRQKEDHLVEIRFFVPGNATVGQRELTDADGEPLAAANIFCDTVKTRMDVGGPASEAIVTFEELLSLTPRGRFQVHMHPSFLRLRGKSHDYKILYTSIKKLFLLPKPDDMHFLFVVGLDPPLRQGQTRYPHMVFQFEREAETELALTLSEEQLEEKYKGVLQKNYDGPSFQVISDIFSGLSGKKALTPAIGFKSAHGHRGVKCSQKANEAILYPLEKAFLSIPKPTIYMSFNEIAAVTFARVSSATSASTKTFEIKFNLTSGVEYTFSSIPREEYGPLESFCRSKKLPVRNEIGDEGMQFVDSEEEDEEGRRKRVALDYADDFDASESEDEDFKEEAESSESDVAEEFNEDYSSEEEGGEG